MNKDMVSRINELMKEKRILQKDLVAEMFCYFCNGFVIIAYHFPLVNPLFSFFGKKQIGKTPQKQYFPVFPDENIRF